MVRLSGDVPNGCIVAYAAFHRQPKPRAMSERAEARTPAEAAAEAVKAYIRLNSEKLSHDGELLALLLPQRFRGRDVGDLQRYVIEKLREENAQLRAERDGLKGARDQAIRLGEGVRTLVLDLLDARSFEEAISVAVGAAPAFGADRAALCVEGEGAAPKNCDGVRLVAPGTAVAVLGRNASGAVLASGGGMLLGSAGRDCRSMAVFRLRVGRGTPALLDVLGAREPARFEGEEQSDLAFFARALERSIRAWLDLPRP
jgi:uncharacterized protein